MKKILLLTTIMFLLTVFIMGCSEDDANQQVATQNINLNTQTESEYITNSVQSVTDYETASHIESTTNTPMQNDSTLTYSYDFSSYEEAINKITKSINDAQTSSDPQVNQDTFYALKQQIDRIENDLDILEDTFEYDYESGKLSFNDYKTRKRSLDKLDDKLEFAEEALENKFHIDD